MGSSIQFEGTRGATSNNITISLTLVGQTISINIVISKLGNIALCSDTVTGYALC